MDTFLTQFNASTQKVMIDAASKKLIAKRVLEIYSGASASIKKYKYKNDAVLWSYGTGLYSEIKKVVLDADENVYGVGSKAFGTKTIWKVDKEGNLIWDTLQGKNLYACAIDIRGDVIVAGYADDNSTFINKINQAQELQWSYPAELIVDICVDLAGNIYACGGNISESEYSLWKFDTNGNMQWRIEKKTQYGAGKSIALRNATDYLIVKYDGGFAKIRRSDGNLLDEELWEGRAWVDQIALNNSNYIYLAYRSLASGGIAKFNDRLAFIKYVTTAIFPGDIVIDRLGNCVVGCDDGVKVIHDDGTILWSLAAASHAVAIRQMYDY